MRYKLREIREAKGISQARLSRESGVSRTTIWAIEKEEGKVITTKTLYSLANALSVEVDDIFFPNVDKQIERIAN